MEDEDVIDTHQLYPWRRTLDNSVYKDLLKVLGPAWLFPEIRSHCCAFCLLPVVRIHEPSVCGDRPGSTTPGSPHHRFQWLLPGWFLQPTLGRLAFSVAVTQIFLRLICVYSPRSNNCLSVGILFLTVWSIASAWTTLDLRRTKENKRRRTVYSSSQEISKSTIEDDCLLQDVCGEVSNAPMTQRADDQQDPFCLY